MKRWFGITAFAIGAVALMLGPTSDAEAITVIDADVWAGNPDDDDSEIVASVDITTNGDVITVLIDDITPGWTIGDVKIGYACGNPADWERLVNRAGNPRFGKFQVSSDDEAGEGTGETSIEITFDPADEQLCTKGEEIFIAIHAQAVGDGSCLAIFYGAELGNDKGDLYTINLEDMTDSLLHDLTDPSPGQQNYPNGVAYDQENNRLYFADNEGENGDGSIYVLDIDTDTVSVARNGTGTIASGTFADGNYWYIANGTDNLFVAPANLDGTLQAPDQIGNGNGNNYGFGDIVVSADGGYIIASTTSGPRSFWIIDLSDLAGWTYNVDPPANYTVHELCQVGDSLNTGDCPAGMQLAIGQDGNLYGHLVSDQGAAPFRHFFLIEFALPLGDLINELDPKPSIDVTDLGTVASDRPFTDLSSGLLCESTDETAQPAATGGTEWEGSRWGQYFEGLY